MQQQYYVCVMQINPTYKAPLWTLRLNNIPSEIFNLQNPIQVLGAQCHTTLTLLYIGDKR